jgi:anti-anti-sigma factor
MSGGKKLSVPPFEVFITWEDSNPVVCVRGELDYGTAPMLREALIQAINEYPEHVSVDLSDVTFLDSEGVKVILQAYRTIRNSGGDFTVLGCSQFVERVFDILGLRNYLTVAARER